MISEFGEGGVCKIAGYGEGGVCTLRDYGVITGGSNSKATTWPYHDESDRRRTSLITVLRRVGTKITFTYALFRTVFVALVLAARNCTSHLM